MAKHGETKIEKRLVTSKVRKVRRKEKRFTVRGKPGPHKRANSVPLAIVLRDLLDYTKNLKEVKFILNKNLVLVDGRTARNYKFPVGLFDLISMAPEKKAYQMIFDGKGRLIAEEIADKKLTKLCKIVEKKAAKGGFIQFTTNDGRNFKERKISLNVGDSIKISLPEQKILETFGLKKGNLSYITGGTHVAEKAVIKEIIPGTMKRPKLITLKPAEGPSFQTIAQNIFVIGEKKSAVSAIK